jgi:hypothetical protein
MVASNGGFFRYNPSAKDSELTGGLYRALAPSKQVYSLTEWNSYHVELRVLADSCNSKWREDSGRDLSAYAEPVKRHDKHARGAAQGQAAPRYIGFQELSRGEIRM